METIVKYYKNSNTGDLIKSQTVVISSIKGIPVHWYRDGKSIGENLELPSGYVEVNEKKFNRESKNAKKISANIEK